MELKEILNQRFSVRKFLDKKVENEKILEILEAARTAPSARNLQPTRVIVVQDNINKMNELMHNTYGCNVVFIVCAEKAGLVSKTWGDVDATIASTLMMVRAWDLGLGTVFIGIFDEEKIKKEFSLPEGYEVVMLIACGYGAADALPSGMHFDKKELKEMMFKESLDNPYTLDK